jgi:hypothetical protein
MGSLIKLAQSLVVDKVITSPLDFDNPSTPEREHYQRAAAWAKDFDQKIQKAENEILADTGALKTAGAKCNHELMKKIAQLVEKRRKIRKSC